MGKEEYEGMDESELDDDELDELEKEELRNQLSNKKPKKKVSKRIQEDEEEDEEEEEAPRAKSPKNMKRASSQPPQRQNEIQRRYVTFNQPARYGIVDAETKEVIGEGDSTVLDVLASILERLERIEDNLGSMIGE